MITGQQTMVSTAHAAALARAPRLRLLWEHASRQPDPGLAKLTTADRAVDMAKGLAPYRSARPCSRQMSTLVALKAFATNVDSGTMTSALLCFKPVVEGHYVQPGYQNGGALDSDSAIHENLS
jgi:hypothetical protein